MGYVSLNKSSCGDATTTKANRESTSARKNTSTKLDMKKGKTAVTKSQITTNEKRNQISRDEGGIEVLRLQHRYCVWQQRNNNSTSRYSDSTEQLTSFDTIAGFWNIWERLPQPSDLLTGRMVCRNKGIDALMIFRHGINPEWEDVCNRDGGHLQFTFKANLEGGQLDEFWNCLVLGFIGGTLTSGTKLQVCGVRLVDKLSTGKGQQAGHGSIRLEVWFDRSDKRDEIAGLRQRVQLCMATDFLRGELRSDVLPLLRPEVKYHGTAIV